ncbi:hypothetical protein G7054_g3518 [Neopestalotiopsis clavispora]|nr:hypothetical protein G7054_g3518 [Neopestalotiopsis clavispora]
MSQHILQPIQNLLTRLLPTTTDPRSRVVHLAIAASLTTGIPLLLSHWLSTYRDWLALGRGGLPTNPLGWLAQAILGATIARSDHRTASATPWTLYAETEAVWGEAGRASYLLRSSSSSLPLPRRAGPRPPRPRVRGAAAADEPAGGPGDAGADGTLRPSALEGPCHQAIWLADDGGGGGGGPGFRRRPAHLRGTRGELVHPHDEGSTHCVLSLDDAARAVELGWAERHRLSGAFPGEVLPWGYVMIYAPRDEAEFAVWKEFVLAAVRFNVEAASSGETSITIPP